jgi:3-isopropylmalate/(R)-2-methylmalate dehydratase small subunit
MEAFTTYTGLAAPLLRASIDTDQIIPTRFLARLSEEGLGEGLFAQWRLLPDGAPNTGFILNRTPWDRAGILVAGPHFGCGSSREAAPRALRQCGFRAVIAPSFGDIFYNNCFRNGIAPVRLDAGAMERLAQLLEPGGQACAMDLTVDLEHNLVRVPSTGESFPFTAPALLRRMLLEGLDEIALTRTHSGAIDDFRARDRERRGWAYL